MNETLQALLSLQEIDRKIFRVERELTRLPKELSDRQEAFEAIEHELAHKRKEAFDLRAQLKEVEDITTGQRQRLRKLEGEAHKTGVDAAMLAHYEHEIRMVKQTVSQAEDDGLKMVDHLERLDEAVNEGQSRIASEKETFDAFRENVEKEIAAAEGRMAELQAKREKATSVDIPPAQLEVYKGLLRTREGEALAMLDGQVCQGCYVSIPKNLTVRLMRGLELVQCPSCDRILYYP